MQSNTPENLAERLLKARKLYGPHILLATRIGIASSTLQKLINGELPEQNRVIKSLNKFLTKVKL